MEKLNDFLQSEHNSYNFQVVSSSGDAIIISIDSDYTFQVNLSNGKVSSSDDFLSDWVTIVNNPGKYTPDNIVELLSSCVRAYEKILGLDEVEESPLYKEGQQVFELENDNYDIKFVERIRISDEHMNDDLLLNCFAFLAPSNVAILGRVSKSWYKLTSNDLLWESFCYREAKHNNPRLLDQKLSLGDHESWKKKYIDEISWGTFCHWDQMSVGVVFDVSKSIATFENQGKAICTPSSHFTIEIERCIWMMYGYLNKTDLQQMMGVHGGVLDISNFNYGYLLYGNGGIDYGSHMGTKTLQGRSSQPIDWNGVKYTSGDVVGATHDKYTGEISFFKNGEMLGCAWDSEFEELYPYVIVSGGGVLKLLPTPKHLIPTHKYGSRH
jgi:hypothetical protein